MCKYVTNGEIWGYEKLPVPSIYVTLLFTWHGAMQQTFAEQCPNMSKPQRLTIPPIKGCDRPDFPKDMMRHVSYHDASHPSVTPAAQAWK